MFIIILFYSKNFQIWLNFERKKCYPFRFSQIIFERIIITSFAESIDTHFDKPKKKPKNRSI